MLLFLTYFAYSIACLIVGIAVYTLITPHREWTLVRQGNVAAACSLGGTAIGLSLPIASLAIHAASLLDMAQWSGIALAVQLLTWFALSRVFHGLSAQIERDNRAVGGLAGALAVALGAINAACLSY
jgi:putative membrane protein